MSECRSPEIIRLQAKLESVIRNDTLSADTVISISDELSSSLNSSQMIFPNDVNSITNLLDTVIL